MKNWLKYPLPYKRIFGIVMLLFVLAVTILFYLQQDEDSVGGLRTRTNSVQQKENDSPAQTATPSGSRDSTTYENEAMGFSFTYDQARG